MINYELYTMVCITNLCCRAENPGTEVGSPGDLQGINTGVEPWAEVFPSYHACDGEVKIMHGHDV